MHTRLGDKLVSVDSTGTVPGPVGLRDGGGGVAGDNEGVKEGEKGRATFLQESLKNTCQDVRGQWDQSISLFCFYCLRISSMRSVIYKRERHRPHLHLSLSIMHSRLLLLALPQCRYQVGPGHEKRLMKLRGEAADCGRGRDRNIADEAEGGKHIPQPPQVGIPRFKVPWQDFAEHESQCAGDAGVLRERCEKYVHIMEISCQLS